MAYIFHERQDAALCGQHCLNNLLQGDHTPSHPAELMYLSDAVAARKRRVIFDDLDQLG